jgi:hypothetical protein
MGRSWILKLREGRARTCISEAIRRTPPAHDAVRAGMLSGTAGVGAGGRTWRERVVPGTNGSEEAADSGDPAACSSPALALNSFRCNNCSANCVSLKGTCSSPAPALNSFRCNNCSANCVSLKGRATSPHCYNHRGPSTRSLERGRKTSC